MERAAADLPGGTVTFFFSDVEGSTRLATALGERFAEQLEAHRRVVRAALAAHGGVEVSTAGDSFFAVFRSATEAAEAAIVIEAGLRAAATLVEQATIRVRIGLHTGQAMRVGRDYVGLDVHLAARVSDAGHGGQILVSEATREAIHAHLPAGCALTDLGRHRLKDVGPQRIWQLDGPGQAPGSFPMLRSLEAHPSNLPLALSPLIDRDPERAELADLVRRTSVVTVTGAGGIGKSRLAIEVARTMVAAFPDGVFYLDLAGNPDASAVAEAMLDVAHLRAPADTDAMVALLDGLRSRDMLLVLDTADRVRDLPALVASIAATCPRLHVLLTSRSPLHVAAEVEFGLAPLPHDPSIELFNARAQAVRRQSPPDRDASAAVSRLVARLDGIPLAIELAAARTKLFTPAVLLDRLERRLLSLGHGALDLPSRQRTLHDTISWSWELLTPAEQSAFLELGVFAGSFDLEAVEAVVAPAGGQDAFGLLEALLDRSLVVSDDAGTDQSRFRLLGPIREFASDGLRASGHDAAVRGRHAQHWIDFVSARLGDQGPPDFDAITAVAANEPDLRAALEWCLVLDGPRPLGLELAGRLGRYWRIRGRVQEGLSWLQGAIATTATEPSASSVGPLGRDLARALFWAGGLLDDAGRHDESAIRLEACLAIQQHVGDDVGVARTLNSLGIVARSLGDLDRARSLIEESIDRKRALGDRAGLSASLDNLGLVASDGGQYDEAIGLMTEALELDIETGGSVVFLSRVNLGYVFIRAGRLHEGVAELRLALPGVEKLGDPELVVEVMMSLARVALALPGEAASHGAARLIFAAGALRQSAGLPIRWIERAELDELLADVSRRVPASGLESLRAEAEATDFDAALSLAREALETTDAGAPSPASA